jgi:N,N'-diacetyllegionaminate synthase
VRNPDTVFIIAECGVNHNGSLEMAIELVEAAVAAGADAAKFQTFRSDALASAFAQKAQYQQVTTDAGEAQLAMLRRLELSEEAHRKLAAHSAARGIEFMSTPFDEGSCDLLSRIGLKRFKVGSGDLTNLPFLHHVASKGLPVILSTGMSTLGEVEQAIGALRGAGNAAISLLHCVTEYPAPVNELNLRAIGTLQRAFGLPVGYSDHTLGNEAAVAAVALGAVIIEKHLTLDKSLPGPDHRASADPPEFQSLVAMLRNVASALGDGVKQPAPSELKNRDIARRSLVTACALKAGTRLSRQLIAIKRPATGIQPADLEKAMGLTLKTDVAADTPITWEMLKESAP